jgi:hypothetical protein
LSAVSAMAVYPARLKIGPAGVGPHSLIRFDICGRDAPVGLNESFDVNFGANSDRSVLLLNHGSFRDDNRSLRDHPDPEKSTGGQLLNDSFKLDLLGFICGKSREGHSDSQSKCEHGHFHIEESSISRYWLQFSA